MNINEVYTLKEVEIAWKGVKGTSEANLRNKFRNGDFDELIKNGLARKTLGGGWLVCKQAMIEKFGELKGEKTMLVTIEKRKNHPHIIGQDLTENNYHVRNKKDISLLLGNEIGNLDGETYEQHREEIDAIYNLEVGNYIINKGDYTYYVEVRESD